MARKIVQVTAAAWLEREGRERGWTRDGAYYNKVRHGQIDLGGQIVNGIESLSKS